jgi:hypothetical protein
LRELAWGALDDVVMGGVSESTFQIDITGSEVGGPTGVVKGLFLLETFNFLSVFYFLGGNSLRTVASSFQSPNALIYSFL